MAGFVDSFIKSINKELKGEFALLIEDGSPTDVKLFIPTGASDLDFKATNRRDGGIPVGKMTAIEGLEATGKSLLAMQIMANAQKMGGLAIYMDTEHALNTDFAKRVGLDVNKNFIHMFPATVEDGFTTLFKLIEARAKEDEKAKEEKRDPEHKFVVVIWDSVTATPTKLDLAAQNPDPSASVGVKARTLSKNMQALVGMTGRGNMAIVFVNQLRIKIGTMPGEDKYEAPGGKAIPYYSSLRVRLQSKGKLKIASTKEVVGIKTVAKVLKSRFGPPFREAEFPIYFTHGIDDEESILNSLTQGKKIDAVKAGRNGTFYKFAEQEKEQAITKREFKNKIYSEPSFREKCLDLMEEYLVKDMIDPRKTDLEEDTDDSEGLD